MGLIRKTLAVSTLGGVNGSSKKQRNAKAIQRAVIANAQINAAGPGTREAQRLAMQLERDNCKFGSMAWNNANARLRTFEKQR